MIYAWISGTWMLKMQPDLVELRATITHCKKFWLKELRTEPDKLLVKMLWPVVDVLMRKFFRKVSPYPCLTVCSTGKRVAEVFTGHSRISAFAVNSVTI